MSWVSGHGSHPVRNRSGKIGAVAAGAPTRPTPPAHATPSTRATPPTRPDARHPPDARRRARYGIELGRRPIQLWKCPSGSGIVAHDARSAVGCGVAAESHAGSGERSVGRGRGGASAARRRGARAGARGGAGAVAAALPRARAHRAHDGVRVESDAHCVAAGRVAAADRLPPGRPGGGKAGVARATRLSGQPEGEGAVDARRRGSARAGGARRQRPGGPARRGCGIPLPPGRRRACAGVIGRPWPTPAAGRRGLWRCDPGRASAGRRRRRG